MTVEADFTAALKTVCVRVKPDFADVGTSRPYITFQQVGGQALNYLEATKPNLDHAEVQVNVWADTRKEARTLAIAIEAALRAASGFTARPLNAAVSDFDADIPVYGCRQDFSVYSVS